MADGLATLGVEVEPRPDGIRIRGGGSGARFGARVKATEVDSSGDHRIAMSFAIAALRASGAIQVRDCANVNTSFPGFASLARGVGLAIEEYRL
jgi:3-phosphoshikimate 1-carboxyvinyltransferase